MLKFIATERCFPCLTARFQNILCWSLSSTAEAKKWKQAPFQNILCWSLSPMLSQPYRQSLISKHLMLKFIYTHVVKSFSDIPISKHLMLKFIPGTDCTCILSLKFQNILCWSLSKERNERRPNHNDFKTSYVEVYRMSAFHKFHQDSFQNILCWSLSEKPKKNLFSYSIFQNILCWSLSPHFLVTFISFYLFSPSFFLISIIFTKHQPIFFFLSNISQIPRLYNTFSTFFFFSPGKYFYNSQSGMGCSSDVFTTENAWS